MTHSLLSLIIYIERPKHVGKCHNIFYDHLCHFHLSMVYQKSFDFSIPNTSILSFVHRFWTERQSWLNLDFEKQMVNVNDFSQNISQLSEYVAVCAVCCKPLVLFASLSDLYVCLFNY